VNRIGRFAFVLGVCLTSQRISAQTPLIGTAGVVNAASYAQPSITVL
jgi:hypothetical protein